LCLYCHDHEHEKTLSTSRHEASGAGNAWPASSFAPFAGLDTLLNSEEKSSKSNDDGPQKPAQD
jgi:hypothetical protein